MGGGGGQKKGEKTAPPGGGVFFSPFFWPPPPPPPPPPALKITATDVFSNSFANGSFTGGFWKQNVCLLVVLRGFERLVVS
ncbi:hypothetical protein IV60_GL001515 [Lancefieldella rimae]|uniref:Uncharacterized protein n=1 Tax=Lancefieldella rimae TaxID=1383 RepID=A0ABR5PYS0_9ACTN|nr:hypothetical protein IV60_GL001515 [Lancefieldella rimae]